MSKAGILSAQERDSLVMLFYYKLGFVILMSTPEFHMRFLTEPLLLFPPYSGNSIKLLRIYLQYSKPRCGDPQNGILECLETLTPKDTPVKLRENDERVLVII